MNLSKDYFSKQSEFYAKYRPTYPEELFQYIASLCIDKNVAWDSATGNGQAANSLANYFKKVFATDFSRQQIGNSVFKENIFYKIERAEECSLDSNLVDLITVATAIHWFDIPEFYKQVDRVLKPNGVLAVWSYAGCRINPELDVVLDKFAFEFLNDYWPLETQMNWKDKYVHLPFPYPLIDSPKFFARRNYNLEQLLNYMFSWSAVQQYIKKHEQNPLDFISEELKSLWGNPEEEKEVIWELLFKCGIKTQS